MSTGEQHYLLHGLDPDAFGRDSELPGIWNDEPIGPAWLQALVDGSGGRWHVG
jgi:hypothetical protein